MTRSTLALSTLAAMALLSGCATAPSPAPLADTLARQSQLSTFNRLVEQAGLKEQLRAEGPLTVFAPSDEAFKTLPAKTMEALQADPSQLKALLSYHIAAAKLQSTQINNSNTKSLQGGALALSRAGAFVTVEDAMVQQADIQATNGVAHVIDRVLTPPKK